MLGEGGGIPRPTSRKWGTREMPSRKHFQQLLLRRLNFCFLFSLKWHAFNIARTTVALVPSFLVVVAASSCVNNATGQSWLRCGSWRFTCITDFLVLVFTREHVFTRRPHVLNHNWFRNQVRMARKSAEETRRSAHRIERPVRLRATSSLPLYSVFMHLRASSRWRGFDIGRWTCKI